MLLCSHVLLKLPLLSFKCNIIAAYKLSMLCFTGSKPFMCKICNFATAQLGDARNHVKRHLGMREYKCDICGWVPRTDSGFSLFKRDWKLSWTDFSILKYTSVLQYKWPRSTFNLLVFPLCHVTWKNPPSSFLLSRWFIFFQYVAWTGPVKAEMCQSMFSSFWIHPGTYSWHTQSVVLLMSSK